MSGVYIKGMEMPKNCPSCPLNYRAWYADSHLCLANNKQIKVNLNIGFDENCPLVPVPAHGRCIDLDSIPKEAWRGEKEDLVDELILAPTIIPVEEGET